MLAAVGATRTASSGTISSSEPQPAKVERQHYIYPWVSTEPGMELAHISAQDLVSSWGVPEKEVREYVAGELKGEQDILSLPWAIITVLLFAMMVSSHEHVSWHNSIETAIDRDLLENANFAFSSPGYIGHKNMEDVNYHADFWSWMKLGFMPLTNVWDHPVSEGTTDVVVPELDSNARNSFLWHHRKMGPIKLSQELSKTVECPNTEMADAYGMQCTANRHIDMLVCPTEWETAQACFSEDTSKTEWFMDFQDANQQRVSDLESSGWLDGVTNRVMISLLTYSGESDLLIMTNINFLFARSGRIWKQLTHRSMTLNPYYGFWAWLWDILYYLQVTYVFCMEVKDMRQAVAQARQDHPHHPLKGLRDYMTVWNAIDWCFVLMSYIMLGLWIHRVSLVSDIQDTILNLPPEAASCTVQCGQYYAHLFDQVESAGAYIRACKVFTALCPLVIMLRLFKAFAAQPRLAVVTKTLCEASPNLAHFLIVFLTIFLSYAVMGVAFFGREVKAFSTLDRSISTLFRAICGGFDFESMQVVGRQFAFFFFFSFMFMIVLVMLSLLLAIMMDVYVEVKAQAKSTESVWDEVADICRRFYQNMRKQRMPLGKVANFIKEDSSDILKVEDLMKKVDGLPVKQAIRILEETAEEYAALRNRPVSPEDVKHYLDDIGRNLDPANIKNINWGVCADVSTFSPKQAPQSASVSLLRSSCDSGESGGDAAEPAAAPALDASLDALLKEMAARIEAGENVPEWNGVHEILKQCVKSAQMMCLDVLHSKAV